MSSYNHYSRVKRSVKRPVINEMAKPPSDPWMVELHKYLDARNMSGKPYRIKRKIVQALQDPTIMGDLLPSSPEELTLDAVKRATNYVVKTTRVSGNDRLEPIFLDPGDSIVPDEKRQSGYKADDMPPIPPINHDPLGDLAKIKARIGDKPFEAVGETYHPIEQTQSFKYNKVINGVLCFFYTYSNYGDSVTMNEIDDEDFIQFTAVRVSDRKILYDIFPTSVNWNKENDDDDDEEEFDELPSDSAPKSIRNESYSKEEEQRIMMENYRRRIKHLYIIENKYMGLR